MGKDSGFRVAVFGVWGRGGGVEVYLGFRISGLGKGQGRYRET